MSCVTSAAPQIDSRFPSRLRALLVISEDELEELVWICRPKGSVICDDPLERPSREHRHHVRCEISLSIGPFTFCIRSRAVQFTNDRANKIIENEDLLRLSEFDICCEAYAYTPRHQTPNANMGVDFQITQGLCSSRYSVYESTGTDDKETAPQKSYYCR